MHLMEIELYHLPYFYLWKKEDLGRSFLRKGETVIALRVRAVLIFINILMAMDYTNFSLQIIAHTKSLTHLHFK